MKIRASFVTNSSSSSFLVAMKTLPNRDDPWFKWVSQLISIDEVFKTEQALLEYFTIENDMDEAKLRHNSSWKDIIKWMKSGYKIANVGINEQDVWMSDSSPDFIVYRYEDFDK